MNWQNFKSLFDFKWRYRLNISVQSYLITCYVEQQWVRPLLFFIHLLVVSDIPAQQSCSIEPKWGNWTPSRPAHPQSHCTSWAFAQRAPVRWPTHRWYGHQEWNGFDDQPAVLASRVRFQWSCHGLFQHNMHSLVIRCWGPRHYKYFKNNYFYNIHMKS